MRKAYKENGDLPTLWIINEEFRIAIECDYYNDYNKAPAPNERCITHYMSERHSTSVIEIKSAWQTPLPVWFYDVMHEYDWLIKI